MVRMGNHFSRIHMTFPDLKSRDFAAEGMSEWGKQAATTSAIIPEVDRAIGWSDNPEHSA